MPNYIHYIIIIITTQVGNKLITHIIDSHLLDNYENEKL